MVGSEAVVEVDGGTIGFRLVGGTVGKAWWLLRRSAKLWRVRLGVLVVGDVFRLVVGSKLVGENDGDAVGGEVVGDVVGPVLGFEPVGDVDGDTFGVLGDVFDGVNACVRGVAGGSDGGHLRSGLSETRCHCSTLQHGRVAQWLHVSALVWSVWSGSRMQTRMPVSPRFTRFTFGVVRCAASTCTLSVAPCHVRIEPMSASAREALRSGGRASTTAGWTVSNVVWVWVATSLASGGGTG